MYTLAQTLRDYDPHIITIIGNRWDAELPDEDKKEAVNILTEHMLDPANMENEWSRLSDPERGALQMLVASPEHKMPLNQFERLYGEIRQMGEEKRRRDKPHLNPVGVAETLFYRGLISLAFDTAKTGTQTFVYIPADLAAVFPIHQTGYDLSEEPLDEEIYSDIPPEGMLSELIVPEPPDKWDANAFLVDDMTTLLAYAQINQIVLKNAYVTKPVEQEIFSHFLGLKSPTRLGMLLKIGYEMGLLVQDDVALVPERAKVRQWLELPRTKQMETLVQAWSDSFLFNELWSVPSLHPDEAGWENDPTLLRDMMRTYFGLLSGKEWISVDGLIAEIKSTDPDFQRPAGDYDSWYIKSAETGSYLNGFENWDAIEGETIRITIIGPMYWLGLINLGKPSRDASLMQTTAFQMTAFGRAWCGQGPWIQAKDPEHSLDIQRDGSLLMHRHVSRYDRFQLARIAEWQPLSDAETFAYRITGSSLQKANQQGIQPKHVEAFLKRSSGTELPASIQSLLGNRPASSTQSSSGVGEADISQLMVLQVASPQQLEAIWSDPAIRQYLGRRLGPTAVVVRTEKAKQCAETLEARGIAVETNF